MKLKYTPFILMLLIMMNNQTIRAANTPLVAPIFPEDTLNISDSSISEGWELVTTYSEVREFGVGGLAKFAHNTTHMFALLVANATNWIAIEFDSDGVDCMMPGNDAWVFYTNTQQQNLQAIDSIYQGKVDPIADAQDDIQAEAIFQGDLITVEVIRKFDTGDSSGGDMTYANGTSMYLTFASDKDHLGDRSPYYLEVQFKDIGNIDEVEVPDVIDWNKRKDLIFASALAFMLVFIAFHFTIRVKFRPLVHGSRFIDSTIMRPPKFKERWNTLLERKPSQDDESADIVGGEN